MGKVINNKMRTLLIMQLLLSKSDENHRIGIDEIIKVLTNNGISGERKSIYDDIETLKAFGLDILYNKEKPSGYYIGNRDFELPELKLLVDAVQSSKFITVKKSQELIRKLEYLTSTGEAKKLHRQVYVANRVKTFNEGIYYNVDAINEAMQYNSRISFDYLKWNTEKELVLRNEGGRIEVSPWSLTWDDENYYLLAYEEETGIVKHYRVDKIKGIELLNEPRNGQKEFKNFDITRFAKRTFGMFGGELEQVILECDNDLIGVILDRFGTDVIIVNVDEDHFQVRHEVAVSGQFYGWLVGLGPSVKIISPKHVAEEYRQRLTDILDNIGGDND